MCYNSNAWNVPVLVVCTCTQANFITMTSSRLLATAFGRGKAGFTASSLAVKRSALAPSVTAITSRSFFACSDASSSSHHPAGLPSFAGLNLSDRQHLGTGSSLLSARYFSSVEVPNPPTSNHPHHDLPNANGSLIYTETDEAPALATFSLLPILTKVRRGRLLQIMFGLCCRVKPGRVDRLQWFHARIPSHIHL